MLGALKRFFEDRAIKRAMWKDPTVFRAYVEPGNPLSAAAAEIGIELITRMRCGNAGGLGIPSIEYLGREVNNDSVREISQRAARLVVYAELSPTQACDIATIRVLAKDDVMERAVRRYEENLKAENIDGPPAVWRAFEESR